MEKEVVRIIDPDDTELDVELISILKDENKKYIVYTKGEKQKGGNMILYISRLKVKEGKYIIDNIHSDDEWGRVKALLSSLI